MCMMSSSSRVCPSDRLRMHDEGVACAFLVGDRIIEDCFPAVEQVMRRTHSLLEAGDELDLRKIGQVPLSGNLQDAARRAEHVAALGVHFDWSNPVGMKIIGEQAAIDFETVALKQPERILTEIPVRRAVRPGFHANSSQRL